MLRAHFWAFHSPAVLGLWWRCLVGQMLFLILEEHSSLHAPTLWRACLFLLCSWLAGRFCGHGKMHTHPAIPWRCRISDMETCPRFSFFSFLSSLNKLFPQMTTARWLCAAIKSRNELAVCDWNHMVFLDQEILRYPAHTCCLCDTA